MQVRTVGGAEAEDTLRPRRPRFTEKLSHPTYAIEPCPREECGFPEADGGFCPECGWTRFVSVCAHCRAAVEDRPSRKRKKEAAPDG